MRVSRLKDAKGITPPKHYNMRTFGLHKKDPNSSENLGLSISYYLPGGGAEFGKVPLEIIYYVLSGEITIKTGKEDIVLCAGDSIHISAGEEREVANESNYPASMLVIANVTEIPS